eukprot:3356711-Rhodomonas_salina.5
MWRAHALLAGAGATARKPEPQAEATQPENVAADAAKQNQDVEAAAPPPPHADPGRPILWATVGALGGMAVGVLAGALWLHREAAAGLLPFPEALRSFSAAMLTSAPIDDCGANIYGGDGRACAAPEAAARRGDEAS